MHEGHQSAFFLFLKGRRIVVLSKDKWLDEPVRRQIVG